MRNTSLKLNVGILFVIAAAHVMAAEKSADVYTRDDLGAIQKRLAAKGGQFASEELQRYSNHYTMVAYRSATGSSEVHEHEADVFFIVSGGATLVTGGRMVNPKEQKPGELRGTSIEGGEKKRIAAGDVMHIPAGTPHQLLVEKGSPITYFVVKVTGQ
jgi:mannose-6-phosphate isomerase-like protein (cupin superfamily)